MFYAIVLSPYLHTKKKMLAPEKKGLAPELFLVLSTPDWGKRPLDTSALYISCY
jgi:hypothetical protein